MTSYNNILVSYSKPWAIQAAGHPFVYFDYNAVGDNTRTYAETGEWERSYTCDLLGRKTTYAEGELFEEYRYDGQNLSIHIRDWYEDGGVRSCTTWYSYTAHRLDSVESDDALTVIYHYNNYGQIDSLYDESGVMCYQYGRMGEVTKETRIYALPFLSQPIALTTQFSYDSWGRVQNITYPDGEVVHYAYDLGGQLERMYNSSYTYLGNVAYDRFGAKVSQTYGNGLVTNYSYNNLTRRLSNIATLNGNSQISTFAYTYDNVGNVTQVTSSCPWRNNQTFTESFTYDAADQLTAAQSVVSGQPSVSNYQLAVTYGNWGKISSYGLTQRDMQHNSTQSETQAYTYPSYNSIGNSQTLFAPEQRTITDANNNVATETLAFGINGSLRKREVQSLSPYTEHYLFNSAANLKAYSNNGLDFAYYGYNASNTRTYKLSMLNQNQWTNGQPEPIHLQLQSAMFYPNAYLNFNQNGEYTKHYYNGTERIASRLGENTVSIAANSNDRFGFRIMQADEQARADLLKVVEAGDIPIETPSVEITSLQPTGNPSDIFYYHTNHLGSTAFVTDQSQTVTQGFLYAPFGEITTEYNATFGNDIIPKYAFNAKELDEETGMYYYEARYYQPPVFTSRDPMFEKYFWMTPYAYCANNPVKYVDPSGDSITMTQEAWNVQKQAFWSVFDRKYDKIPFSYDKETGKMNYTGENASYTYSEIQQEIINNYKSLCENKSYHVNVSIVENEQEILSNGVPTTLKDRFAMGVINEKGNGADVYISRNPLYRLNEILTECPQREDNQSIAILHEIGGHAYYYSQGYRKKENDDLTTAFEGKCRKNFYGKYGSREIRREEPREH